MEDLKVAEENIKNHDIDNAKICDVYSARSLAATQMENFEEAEEYLNHLLEAYKRYEIEYKVFKPYINNTKGHLQMKKGNYDEAIKIFEENIKIRDTILNKGGIIYTVDIFNFENELNIGHCYSLKGPEFYSQSEKWLNEVIRLSDEYERPRHLFK
eukprot:CAMPEP_0114592138 /NCGR_PEP_ID=MMETSP0125-20121206/14046_1 /TAXON_ID=485358 ORGANISM="Aristerostoma sp., Strain ATCC 50986" /NCGR_SAMPLE_ID=MMETSP0125 /ASSEMBLY_ACC=CAM_ASM_000245 /LENGTH=155 /DNA_ID=CAMNT_0001790645 /DNA_START=2410 /DNA_END=2877 /DNA_ORIENTATION=+